MKLSKRDERAMLVGFVCLGAILAWQVGSRRLPEKPSAYKASVTEIAQALQESDRVGDPAIAAAQIDKLTLLLRTMEGDPVTRVAGPPRSCSLAALHLGTALKTIAEGNRWIDRDQFQAAYRDCR